MQHGWQLGEHNDWHKQTAFELANRVPLIVAAPGKPASHGRRAQIMAELVDVYPTLAALAGTGAPVDELDGSSLAAVFDDTSLLSVPSRDTYNKSVAYQQYPGQFYGCNLGYIARNGTCTNASFTRVPGAMSQAQAQAQAQPYMGYAVRTHEWRYVAWYPLADASRWLANWSATTRSNPPVFLELYDHRGDNGSDYDWPGNNHNLAFDRAAQDVLPGLHAKVEKFFRDWMPPNPPAPTSKPTPVPTPPCVGGWRSIPDHFCAGKGEKTDSRYIYQGNDTATGCRTTCALLNCTCADTDARSGRGTCRLQNETQKLATSGLGFDAYLRC